MDLSLNNKPSTAITNSHSIKHLSEFYPKATKEEILKSLSVIPAFFPSLEFSPEKIESYSCALDELSFEQLKTGIKKFCLLTDQVYPNTNFIALIRKYALGIDELPTAGESWESALPLIRGDNIPLTSLPELTQRAIRAMGGLCELGMCQNIEAARSQYTKIYNDFLETKKREILCGK
jgi:hypothetical protein